MERLLSLDMRELLAALGADDQVLRVRKTVEPRFELAAVTKHIQQNANLPVVFEQVAGTRFPVVSNIYGNYGLVARMFGTTTSGLAATWSAETGVGDAVALDDPSGDVPEVEEIGFAELPHITFCEKDAGPYLTAAIVLARDPDGGATNLSYHRMQMIGDGEIRTRLGRSGDLYRFQQAAERRNKSLEVAVILGTPPAVTLAAAAVIPAGESELGLAERFAGRRFAMRRCESVDLEVPGGSEFVLEGEILPHERRPEGPFGEWMDFYVPETDNHVLMVRRIVAREDAVFHAIVAGSVEEITLSAIPNAATIYRAVRSIDADVKDVACYPFMQFVAIRIEKRYEGQPAKVMLGAFGAETNRQLYCVVVDEDVDIHDLKDVIWAMSTRCRPDRDIIQIPNVPSYARDPHRLHWGRLGVDATAPLEHKDEFERKRYPGLDTIRLEDYL